MLCTDTSGWGETSNNYLIFIADIFLHATVLAEKLAIFFDLLYVHMVQK